MPINAKNKPGCPCCQCECADGTLYPKFTRIKVVISGLPASYSYTVAYDFEGTLRWGSLDAVGGKYFYGTITINGLDDLNGTHFFDVPHTPENCLEQEDYETGLIDSVLFDFIDGSHSMDAYTDTCEYLATVDDAWYGQGKIELYRFADERWRIKLSFEYEQTSDLDYQFLRRQYFLYGCQNLGCGNDFDATQDLTFDFLPDDGSNYNTGLDCDNTQKKCNTGKIWGNTGDPINYEYIDECDFDPMPNDCLVEHGTISAEITN